MLLFGKIITYFIIYVSSAYYMQNHSSAWKLCNTYIIFCKVNWNALLSNNDKEVHSKYPYKNISLFFSWIKSYATVHTALDSNGL